MNGYLSITFMNRLSMWTTMSHLLCARRQYTVDLNNFLHHIPMLLYNNMTLQSAGGDINSMQATDLSSLNSQTWLAGGKALC